MVNSSKEEYSKLWIYYMLFFYDVVFCYIFLGFLYVVYESEWCDIF